MKLSIDFMKKLHKINNFIKLIVLKPKNLNLSMFTLYKLIQKIITLKGPF
jgi:hypothetical protein